VPADAQQKRTVALIMRTNMEDNGTCLSADGDAYNATHARQTHWPTCSVPGCTRPAVYKAMLVDWKNSYSGDGWFRAQDEGCPFLCDEHMRENEGTKKDHGGGVWEYPYTKGAAACSIVEGWTEYKRLRRRKADLPD